MKLFEQINQYMDKHYQKAILISTILGVGVGALLGPNEPEYNPEQTIDYVVEVEDAR